MSENIISQETAQAAVKKLLDFYDIEVDKIKDVDRRHAVEEQIEKLISGVTKGRLEIEVEGPKCQIKQYLKIPVEGVPNPIVYKEVTGRAQAEPCEDNSNPRAKIQVLLGVVSGYGPAIFKAMIGADNSYSQAIGTIFFQL
jgi:hypothetical protein